jgi:hypothetical protein
VRYIFVWKSLTGQERKVYMVLMGNPECRWEVVITVGLWEIDWRGGGDGVNSLGLG